jgi:hypothetical protein
MSRYTVQRPTTVWIEAVVDADSIEQALDLADEDFKSGDYAVMEMTYDIDYDRYWVQDKTGLVSYV